MHISQSGLKSFCEQRLLFFPGNEDWVRKGEGELMGSDLFKWIALTSFAAEIDKACRHLKGGKRFEEEEIDGSVFKGL